MPGRDDRHSSGRRALRSVSVLEPSCTIAALHQEPPTMMSISAYYVLVASTAAEKAAAEAATLRAPRPSLVDRLRAFVTQPPTRPRAARPA